MPKIINNIFWMSDFFCKLKYPERSVPTKNINFCVGGPSWKFGSDWAGSTHGWLIIICWAICMSHTVWLIAEFRVMIRTKSCFCFEKTESSLPITYKFTNESYTNNWTYENESSICLVQPIKGELLTEPPTQKSIETMQYIFSLIQISYSTCLELRK